MTFDPSIYNAADAPQFANPAGTLIDRTTGDLLVGIIQAGVNSPYGDAIYEFKKNSIQPRIGVSWDPNSTGNTIIVRGAYGIYYDQPLVGIFEQNAFTMPPIVNNVIFTNPRLSNPAAGQTPTTTGVRAINATPTDFDNPRMMQWSGGVTRRLWRQGLLEVSYVGSSGDNLIRPTDINYPQPGAVVAYQQSVAGAVNPVRPYRSLRGHHVSRDDGAIELPRPAHGVQIRGRAQWHGDGQLHAEPQSHRFDQRPRCHRHPAESARS